MHVESKMKLQANSRLWYLVGELQLLISKVLVGHNLIMMVCHLEMSKFKTVSTNWGCEHEKITISGYLSISQKKHHNFQVRECGIFISTSHSFIGASPDSLAECTMKEFVNQGKNCALYILSLQILVSILSQAWPNVRGCGRCMDSGGSEVYCLKRYHS